MTRSQDITTLAGHPIRQHRKHKNILEILCGHDDGYDVCHRVIGWIWLPLQPVPSGRREPRLSPAPGYYLGPDGVWYETRHAAENVRHGREPRYRRPIARGADGRDALVLEVVLWLRVRCSRCHTVYTLHDDELAPR